MSEILLTPEDSGATVELSRTVMRKRILPKGSINYKGRKIVFDDAYLSQVAEAYKAGAYDQVPVQMADKHNAHTMDPERFGGEIVGVEVADDGLYGTFSFTERGAQLVKENPKLGVSARLVGNYERSDGKTFPAAMQHVLLTQDPRIPGLGAWTEVNLSGYHDSDEVVDLTNASYEGENAVADNGNENEAVDAAPDEGKIREALKLVGYTDAEVEEFFASIEAEAAEEAGTEEATAETEVEDEGTEEVDETDTDAVAETEEGRELEAALSNDVTDTVDLGNDDLRTRLAAAEKTLAESRFEAEKAKWVGQGVPPAFVDLAADVLKAPANQVIVDLSNGPDEDRKIDAAAVIRKLISTTAGYIKIAEERGHSLEFSNADESEGKATDELENVWAAINNRFDKN